MIVLVVIGPRLVPKGGPPGSGGGDLTLEELSHCDGREGRRASIAYKRQMYDVTMGYRILSLALAILLIEALWRW